jgi:hypothetical protein
MTQKKPVSVIVIAVFHFIFGALGLLCGACAAIGGGSGFGGGNAAPPPPAGGNPQAAKEVQEMTEAAKKREEIVNRLEAERAPWQKTYQRVMTVMTFVFPVLLIVAGIGLLMVKPWGRLLSLAYAVLALLFGLGGLAIWYTVSRPIIQEVYSQVPPVNQIDEGVLTVINWTVPIVQGLSLIYPVIVLLVMFLPSVKLALSGQAAAPPSEPEDYHDRRNPGEGTL